MTPLQWLRLHIHARIDYPGGDGGECVDACNSYISEVYGLAPIRANARDWAGSGRPGLLWTTNLPDNAPASGDVVVWRGPAPAEGITQLGHVAVVVAADSRVLLTADQNWSGRRYLTVNLHDFDGVSGWLSPALRKSAPRQVERVDYGLRLGKARAGAS